MKISNVLTQQLVHAYYTEILAITTDKALSSTPRKERKVDPLRATPKVKVVDDIDRQVTLPPLSFMWSEGHQVEPVEFEHATGFMKLINDSFFS